MTTLLLRNSVNHAPLRRGVLLIALALACFAFPRAAQAEDGAYQTANTAEGDGALNAIVTNPPSPGLPPFGNTAIGHRALSENTTGNDNTATGDEALIHNTTSSDNTATGAFALHENTTGSLNTATGDGALFSNATGNNNTANGVDALIRNFGSGNIALGYNAGQHLTSGDNNIDIGNGGVDSEANTIRIGDVQTATFIAGINGVNKSSGNPVFIDANGQLGTASASPPGSVVMLPTAGGVAPPAPAGYVFKGFILLAAKANGGGAATSYAVYTKS